MVDTPAIDTSTSDWASQLVTVRKTQNDRVTVNGNPFDHVLLTFGFDTAVRLTGIELDLFLCPDMNIDAPFITVFANNESNLVFTYDPAVNDSLPFESYGSSQSSCDSLSIVIIDFEQDGLVDLSFLTWHILISSFTSSIDWVYIGDVRFIGMDDSHQMTCTTPPITPVTSQSKHFVGKKTNKKLYNPVPTTHTTSYSYSRTTLFLFQVP